MTYIIEHDTSNPAGNPKLSDIQVPDLTSNSEYEKFYGLLAKVVAVPKSVVTDQPSA